MQQKTTATIYVLLLSLLFTSSACAFELSTRYATIIYIKKNQLQEFNDNVFLGSLSYLTRRKRAVTVEDEVKNKLDTILEKVESTLEVYPSKIRLRVILLDSEDDVRKAYARLYGKSRDFVAFYSPREKTLYLSLRNVTLGLLAHELAHVVIDHYFGISPPVKIHEVLAQYVETHIED